MNEQKHGTNLLERSLPDSIDHTTGKLASRIMSMIFGGIIGDALGVPVEFNSRDCGVTTMQGYGTYNQPPGTWSDDTSLTLCLMETLMEAGTPDHLMQKFVRYQHEGYCTPYGKMFDIGLATQQSIARFQSGIPARDCGGKSANNNGNGALMRISPIYAICMHELNFETRCSEVIKWATITHAHPRSTLGCIIYLDLLFYLGQSLSKTQSLQHVIDDCHQYLADSDFASEWIHYQRIFDQSVIHAPRDTIRSSGYVVDSLEAAIWCLFNTHSYKEAVLAAVNLGEDTDTIGFITGTLAGIYYQWAALPEEWMNQLARKEWLYSLCEKYIQYVIHTHSNQRLSVTD